MKKTYFKPEQQTFCVSTATFFAASPGPNAGISTKDEDAVSADDVESRRGGFSIWDEE